MRILLIAPRYTAEPNQYYEYPVGLCLLSACLKRAGHNVIALNLNHEQGDAVKNISRILASYDVDMVASGGLSPHYALLLDIFQAARAAKKNIPLVCGGGIISSEPELMTQSLGIDIGVIGEGEETIVQLADVLDSFSWGSPQAKDALREIKGLCLAGTPPLRTDSRPEISDLDSLPFPDYAAFGVEAYLDRQKPRDSYYMYPYDKPRMLPVIASRSCPYACTFCFHPLGNKYRHRSLDNLFMEIGMLVREYEINMLAILDELFGVREKDIMEFCSRIEPFGLKWVAQMRVDRVTEAGLRCMRDAGLFYISYGLESAAPSVLQSMRKHISVKQIEDALKITSDLNIGIQGNFIFGDRAETPETVDQTLEWWRRHTEYGINMGYVIPYPGSNLYIEAVEKGLIHDRLEYIKSGCPTVELNAMSPDEVNVMCTKIENIQNEHKRFGKFISMKHVKDATYMLEIECPFCKKISVYKNFEYMDKDYKVVHCKECNKHFSYKREMNFFIESFFDAFKERLENVKINNTPVAILPFLDDVKSKKYLELFSINSVDDFNVICTFDNMERYHNKMQFGKFPVRARTKTIVCEEYPDMVFVVLPCYASQRLVDDLRENYRIAPERIFHFPQEIDLDAFE